MADSGLTTDAAVLAQEAGNFDRIASELKGVMAHVEAEASSLAAALASEGAGQAAQAALARFHEAALQQQQELIDISNNIHTAATHYTSTDHDQASALHSQMQL